MDYQFWIWLILIVITILARSRRKKPEPEAKRRDFDDRPLQRQEEQVETNPRPLTFEELLKEIQASRAPKPLPVPRPEPVKSLVVDYDDDIEVEEKNYETIANREEKGYDVYEKAKQDAFYRPSLEETMKLEDTVVRFTHFKGYQSNEEKSPLSGYLRELRDPQGFRKAFIMSEILRRKF